MAAGPGSRPSRARELGGRLLAGVSSHALFPQVIEDPAADISTGMARLATTLMSVSQLPVSQACDTLLAALAPRPADDIAILMART